jgi:hypothetical protein
MFYHGESKGIVTMGNFLTQQEADTLLALEKHYKGNEIFKFPSLGGNLRIPLHSTDNREEFILDVSRGSISLEKNKFQTRARTTIILIRVDIGGAPHRNPDGTEIKCPHIHFYKAGFDDKWAEPLSDYFKNATDSIKILHEFMNYCTIITKPSIQEDLFS